MDTMTRAVAPRNASANGGSARGGASLAPPLEIADMSVAEKLACRYFLPDKLQPAGLGTEEEIWAEYASR